MPPSSCTVTEAGCDSAAPAPAAATAASRATTQDRRTPMRPPVAIACRPVRVPVVIAAPSEGDHAFEHQAVELAAVLDVDRRVAEVGLLDVLGLGEQAGQDEPAAADLHALRPHFVDDPGQVALRLVVAG